MVAEMVAELDSIIQMLERGRDIWRKVSVLDKAELIVVACCNSERCQRVKVLQISARGAVVIEDMTGPTPDKMPPEIEKILDVCRTNPALEAQVKAYNRSRFDLIFKCRGGILFDWAIGDA